ncbi:MAG TPA: efflux RND transporter periplasmic adaptor subunit [Gemmatimonadaceae bacterium]|nr:efflux RND transporter periplasmic adaptor subunit [Gemmatimonadaceae bacterium]
MTNDFTTDFTADSAILDPYMTSRPLPLDARRPRDTHRAPRAAAALLVAALLGGSAAGCAKKDPPPKQPEVPVTIAVARRVAAPYAITANGVVEPLQTARVTAQVSGLVQSVEFREGDAVRAGQVLFRIDSRPYRAALAQAEAALARDQAQAAGAHRDAERYQELAKQDYVTKSQAEGQTTNAAALSATVAADRAAVDKARFDLGNTIVRAPIAGRTGSLLVRAGNVVAPSATQPLVVINQTAPILVRFTVPAAAFPDVQRFRRRGPLSVRVTSGGAADTATGTLTFVDNAVDTTTGTVMLKGEFPNRDGQLWPGEFVNTTLVLEVEAGALVVPSKAVQTGQQGTYVFVVQENGTAAQRPITVGRTVGDAAVVRSGLREGEKVVADGQSRLGPGSRVRVTAEEKAPLTGGDAPAVQ